MVLGHDFGEFNIERHSNTFDGAVVVSRDSLLEPALLALTNISKEPPLIFYLDGWQAVHFLPPLN
jgi:hypothetical protein